MCVFLPQLHRQLPAHLRTSAHRNEAAPPSRVHCWWIHHTLTVTTKNIDITKRLGLQNQNTFFLKYRLNPKRLVICLFDGNWYIYFKDWNKLRNTTKGWPPIFKTVTRFKEQMNYVYRPLVLGCSEELSPSSHLYSRRHLSHSLVRVSCITPECQSRLYSNAASLCRARTLWWLPGLLLTQAKTRRLSSLIRHRLN